MGTWFAITIQGRLEQRWSGWFDGAALDSGNDGTTVLRVEVADQAALHALIRKVADLGLTLIGLTQPEYTTRDHTVPLTIQPRSGGGDAAYGS